MKRVTLIGFAMALTLGILSADVHASTRAEALFEEALIKESGERDPEVALSLYRQAIEQSGPDSRLVAKAWLHMASCLERLGKPKEAEALYQQIIRESSASSADAIQAAQTNLEKLQVQEKKAKEAAAKARPMMLVKEFHDTHFSGIVGPGVLRSGRHTGVDLSLAGRYRLSGAKRPLGLYGEVGVLVPFGGSTIQESVKTYNSSTTDTGSLKLNYQMHVALVTEVPHKSARTIPEVGIGLAWTSSQIHYRSTGSTGDVSETHVSPYLLGGIRFFADKRVSLVTQFNYTANPYSKNIPIASPAHKQTFDVPSGLWNLSAMAQIRIGWTKAAMRPKE